MRLDDYCCLGRTVPELSKKYGISVCSAGYSRDLDQFVRLYPLPVFSPIRQRSIAEVELTRPGHDSRWESWRLNRELPESELVNVVGEEPTQKVMEWLIDHQSESIAKLNDEKSSLGLIKAEQWEGYFVDRDTKKEVDPCQKELFDTLDGWRENRENPFQFKINKLPYLRFKDQDGWHNLQLREWGAYAWFGKEPDKYEQIWKNYLKDPTGKDLYLLVGNMCNRRTTWLVINLFPHKQQSKEKGLFDGICSSESGAMVAS